MKTGNPEEERERIERALSERIEAHDKSRRAVQARLDEICEGLEASINGLEDRVSSELEEKSTAESNRLQSALAALQMDDDDGNAPKAVQRAKAELLVARSYKVAEHSVKGKGLSGLDVSSLYELKTETTVDPEAAEVLRPTDVRASKTEKGVVSLQFTCLNPYVLKVFSRCEINLPIQCKCLLTRRGENGGGREYDLKAKSDGSFTLNTRRPVRGAAHGVRVRVVLGDRESEWSDEVELAEEGAGTETPRTTKSSQGTKKMKEEEEEEEEEECEKVERVLSERIEAHDENRRAAQDRLHSLCEGLRGQVAELKSRVNKALEEVFTAEDRRLQTLLSELRTADNYSEALKMLQRAKAELLVVQSYDVIESAMNENNDCDESYSDLVSLYELKTERRVARDMMEARKPEDFTPSLTKNGDLSLSFTFFSEYEVEVLKSTDLSFEVEAKMWEKGCEESTLRELTEEYTSGSDEGVCLRTTFTANTTYCLKMRISCQGVSTQWSDEIEFTTPEFRECCVWKECPEYDVEEKKRYSVDEETPRIATKISLDWAYCTIIGSTAIPLNTVTSWSIKLLKSKYYNGGDICIGVVPFGIDQNEDDNYNKCGWYIDCWDSMLCSGPPHNYRGKVYGLRKEDGQYVHTGDRVGVVMDTAKGELSFVLDGMSLGVAYEGVPLDKPLVPCTILKYKGDSVELDTSEVKENVDSSIPVPSNITAKSITWDSITLTWDVVEGASFYQIEVDGNKSWNASATNEFTKGGLTAETKHSFRVRAVKGSSVSEWSVVKEKTQKAPTDFSECVWKECPGNVCESRKYSVDEKNPRISVTKGYDWSTIIGNTAIPLSTVTSWSIKVLKSRDNNGYCIYIGVAPFGIDQNEDSNYKKCGWYFHFYNSMLCSGPPHNYRGKIYGLRKEDGQYMHNGDSVGVVMDTAKGELSFVLDGVNLGVAYEGIPLDKPLVPCVLLGKKGDSVELDTSEVKETVADSSVPVPSNIKAKSGITWDSVTLTWDAVEGASFYQIEVDGKILWDAPTTNALTKRGLSADTEYSFRVRAVRGSSVSGWSGVVKGRTRKESFKTSGWKECPDGFDEKRKYSLNEKTPRIVTKVGGYWCTIIGNTPLPPNTVKSWSIKVLKLRHNYGGSICIGVAPSDIDQNEKDNYNKCGWYFNCCYSMLYSGPPHNYNRKEYGLRKGKGQYVRTGDNVGVVMDTAKGELSFVLNGVNLGVAYEGIPLDKPLVPCVLLGFGDDSVELVI